MLLGCGETAALEIWCVGWFSWDLLYLTTLMSSSIRKNLRGKGNKNRLESLQHDLLVGVGASFRYMVTRNLFSGVGSVS